MRNFILIFFLIFSLSIHAQTETPQQCIESFFEAFHKKDTVELRSILHNEAVIKTILQAKKSLASILAEEGLTSIVADNPDNFLKSLANIPSDIIFREEIESYNIEEDGLLAHVWTPYSFYVNEKLSHRGINSFVLVNFDGKWKIVHLIDTRVKG